MPYQAVVLAGIFLLEVNFRYFANSNSFGDPPIDYWNYVDPINRSMRV